MTGKFHPFSIKQQEAEAYTCVIVGNCNKEASQPFCQQPVMEFLILWPKPIRAVAFWVMAKLQPFISPDGTHAPGTHSLSFSLYFPLPLLHTDTHVHTHVHSISSHKRHQSESEAVPALQCEDDSGFYELLYYIFLLCCSHISWQASLNLLCEVVLNNRVFDSLCVGHLWTGHTELYICDVFESPEEAKLLSKSRNFDTRPIKKHLENVMVLFSTVTTIGTVDVVGSGNVIRQPDKHCSWTLNSKKRRLVGTVSNINNTWNGCWCFCILYLTCIIKLANCPLTCPEMLLSAIVYKSWELASHDIQTNIWLDKSDGS